MSYSIPIIILSLGFITCIILILRSRFLQRRKHIDEYKDSRDKLTNREEPKEEEEEYGRGFSLGNLIGGFIVICIGFTLLPTVNEAINGACSTSNNTLNNITNVGNVILCNSPFATGGIPILFALAIVGTAMGLLFSSLRRSGLV